MITLPDTIDSRSPEATGLAERLLTVVHEACGSDEVISEAVAALGRIAPLTVGKVTMLGDALSEILGANCWPYLLRTRRSTAVPPVPPRPENIPDGYIHQLALRSRGWDAKTITKHLREHRLHDGTANSNISPYWYPQVVVAAVEAENEAVRDRLALFIPRRPSGYTTDECMSELDILLRGWTRPIIRRVLGAQGDTDDYECGGENRWYASERVFEAERRFPGLSEEAREARVQARLEARWRAERAEAALYRAMSAEVSVPVVTHNGTYCVLLPHAEDALAHFGSWVRADHPQSSGVWVAQPFERVATLDDGDVYSIFTWSGPHYPDPALYS